MQNQSWQLFSKQGQYAEQVMRGLALYNKGDFVGAESEFTQYLETKPNDADILNYQAVTKIWLNKPVEAEELVRRAIAQREDSGFYNTLGSALSVQGKAEEAHKMMEKAVQLSPYNWDARVNLGRIVFDQQKFFDVIQHLEVATSLRPDVPHPFKYLADAYRATMQFVKAEEAYRKYLSAHENDAEAQNNFGLVLEANKKWEEAQGHYKKASELDPNNAQICRNYAAICNFLDQGELALEAYRKALKADPTSPWIYSDIIQVLARSYDIDKAYLYSKTLETLPNFDPVEHAMGDRMVAAVCDFAAEEQNNIRRLERYKKLPINALGPLFLTEIKYCKDEKTTMWLTDIHRKWGEWATQKAASTPISEDTPLVRKHPRRKKVRIGFLSSDLRTHVVSKFLMPLMKYYNKGEIEIYCYSLFKEIKDANQTKIRESVAKFDFVDKMYDNEIAEHIRKDELDILFDLNGHTADNRVQVMAYKLAPVQIAWMGYPITWGVKEIDYAMVDRFSQPENPATFVEELLIMPNCYLCYALGLSREPDVEPVPYFERHKQISFGTFNNPIKYTRECVHLWANVLLQVPDSRFVFVRPEAHSTFLQQNLINEFTQYGVDKERIFFIRNQPGTHLQYYSELDISLDVTPLTGGTTTCESMSMGVPVVTRFGDATHQRLSRTFLSNAGFPGLCAASDEQFVEIAANLAHDTNLIRNLRKNLRGVMAASPLCDEAGFARDFEGAMQQIVTHHGLR